MSLIVHKQESTLRDSNVGIFMQFDGAIVRDLLIQAPTIAILLIIIYLDRRDHAKTMLAMREENAKLQTALIDHMNRKLE